MKPAFIKLYVVIVPIFFTTILSGSAIADETSPYGNLSAILTLQSDNRFRGYSLNNREPTPEMELYWSGPDNIYAGTYLSKEDWYKNTPSYETDWFIGRHTDLYGTDLNTMAIYYTYPDAAFANTASFMEVFSQLSHSFDKLTLAATGAYSPQWSLHSGEGWYGAGTAKYAFTGWLSMSATFGHQWVADKPVDYSHWDLGMTAAWRAFSLDVRYIDTDLSKTDCALYWMRTNKACDAGLDVSVSYTIPSVF